MADKQVNINIVVSEKGVRKAIVNQTKILQTINKINVSMRSNIAISNSYSTTINNMSKSTDKLANKTKGSNSAFKRFHSVLIGIMGINFVRRLAQYTDAWVNLTNSVRLGVKEFFNLSPVMERVFAIAQRSRTDLEPISKLFRRMSLASDELGASYEEMLRVTETISKAIKISGSTTQESARAIEQLAQAFSEGVIKAKDFRSIISQAPRIVSALADELTNGNISLLKTMLSTEQISIQQIFQGLIAQSSAIDKEFGTLTKTISEGFAVFENAARKYVGQIATSLKITDKFSKVMNFLADNINLIAEFSIALAAGAIAGLAAAFSAMIIPMLVIGGSVFAIIKLYKEFDIFKKSVDFVVDSLFTLAKIIKKMTFKELIVRFKYSFAIIGAIILDSFQAVGNNILIIFSGVLNSITQGFYASITGINTLFKNMFTNILKGSQQLGKNLFNIINKDAPLTSIFDDTTNINRSAFLQIGKNIANAVKVGWKEGVDFSALILENPKATTSIIKMMNDEISKLPKPLNNVKKELEQIHHITGFIAKGWDRISELGKDATLSLGSPNNKGFAELDFGFKEGTQITSPIQRMGQMIQDDLPLVFDTIDKFKSKFMDTFDTISTYVSDKYSDMTKDLFSFLNEGDVRWKQYALTVVDSFKFIKDNFLNIFPTFDELFNGIENGLDTMVNKWSDMTKSIENWTVSSFDKMGDALWNFFANGKSGWKDLARSAIQELNKILFHKLVASMLQGLSFGSSALATGSLLPAGFGTGASSLAIPAATPNLGMFSSGSSLGQATLLGSSAPNASLPMQQQQQQSTQTVNSPEVKVNIVNALDNEAMANAIMASPAGQKVIMNTVKANERQLRRN